MARHPHRLPRAHYIGRYTYFLTASTHRKLEVFRDAQLVAACRDRFLRASSKHRFANIAHTYMPDHVHALVEGQRGDSDFIKWLDLWRQLTGFYWRERSGQFLWEEGYWDYTLRDDDAVIRIASYIVWNPVRAGLAARPELYPFTGSDRWSVADIASHPQVRPTRRQERSDG
jgi:REP element-mobilizing transposase RayT